jgi:methionyl-tRNA formyltransferase
MRNHTPGRLRVAFFGSPEFAVPTLRALIADDVFEVVLVVTQGAKGPSPVELAAIEASVPTYKPESLKDSAAREPIVSSAPDLFVVAAFGLIFRRSTLSVPRHGAINVHPSLLPKYRGASPMPAAIASGDRMTGVSLMVMDSGIDTGAVVSIETVAITDDDTTETLGRRLGAIGAEQVVRDIPRWLSGELIAVPQPTAGASLTRTLSKRDGWLDWRRPAIELERQVRAMWPWPRAWTTVDDSTIQVHHAQVAAESAVGLEPGSVLPLRKRIVVACGSGALELLVVEPAGRKRMTASAYLNGLRHPLLRLGGGRDDEDFRPLVTTIS